MASRKKNSTTAGGAEAPPACNLGAFAQRGLEGLGRALARAGVGAWDVALIGDGSGDWQIQTGAGWAVVAVDRPTGRRACLYGAASHGTTYDAELLPYVHALLWHRRAFPRHAARRGLPASAAHAQRVAIVSDSRDVVLGGRRLEEAPEQAARLIARQPVWAALIAAAHGGYALSWHHMDRAQIGLNDLADVIGRLARQAVSADERLKLVERAVRERHHAELAELATLLNRFEDPEPPTGDATR